jgi:F-type H+-transporting ATPase subunit epsilon
MADSVFFELVSPEKLLESGDVAMVVVPGTEGDFAVMPGLAPVVSTLRPGVIEVYRTEGSAPEKIFIHGGFADAAMNRLTILADDAVHVGHLTREAVDARVAKVREDIATAQSDESRLQNESALEQLMDLANVHNHNNH